MTDQNADCGNTEIVLTQQKDFI